MPASQALAMSSTAYASPRTPRTWPACAAPSAERACAPTSQPSRGPVKSETSMPASAPMAAISRSSDSPSSIAPDPCETRLTTISCSPALRSDLREHARALDARDLDAERRAVGEARRARRRRRCLSERQALECCAGLHAAAPVAMSRIAVRSRPSATDTCGHSPVSVRQRSSRSSIRNVSSVLPPPATLGFQATA